MSPPFMGFGQNMPNLKVAGQQSWNVTFKWSWTLCTTAAAHAGSRGLTTQTETILNCQDIM